MHIFANITVGEAENMMDFDEYIRQDEPQKREKGYAWQTAIGLQAVDGLKPSDYLIETARKDIEGEITIDEAERLIRSYYQSKIAHTPEDAEIHEADMASTNIRRLLTEKTFAFTLVGLTSIHRRIFDGIFKSAGQIRDYNINGKFIRSAREIPGRLPCSRFSIYVLWVLM